MIPGVFTTLRVRDGGPWFWADHVERLTQGARALGLDAPSPERLLRQVLARAEWPDARVRVTLEGGPPRIDARAYAPPNAPWRLRTVTASPDEDTVRLKTTARRVYDDARRAAAGCDDALLVDGDGFLLECTVANVFLVDGGRIRTPPGEARILSGIARKRVLEAARALGLDAAEEPIPLERVRSCSACFVTNALFLVHPVAEILGGAPFPDGGLARRLRRAVRAGCLQNV